jgi:hypothetical protein
LVYREPRKLSVIFLRAGTLHQGIRCSYPKDDANTAEDIKRAPQCIKAT